MRACIHRGAREIGGTCVEIESQGKRLVLDVGTPLDAEDAAKVDLPGVSGFINPDPSLLGILLSHPHNVDVLLMEGTTVKRHGTDKAVRTRRRQAWVNTHPWKEPKTESVDRKART